MRLMTRILLAGLLLFGACEDDDSSPAQEDTGASTLDDASTPGDTGAAAQDGGDIALTIQDAPVADAGIAETAGDDSSGAIDGLADGWSWNCGGQDPAQALNCDYFLARLLPFDGTLESAEKVEFDLSDLPQIVSGIYGSYDLGCAPITISGSTISMTVPTILNFVQLIDADGTVYLWDGGQSDMLFLDRIHITGEGRQANENPQPYCSTYT